MAKQFTDKSSRKFDPMAVSGLSNEAREAVNAAFDAMSTWRTQIVDNSEKTLSRLSRRWLRRRGHSVGLSKLFIQHDRKCKP